MAVVVAPDGEERRQVRFYRVGPGRAPAEAICAGEIPLEEDEGFLIRDFADVSGGGDGGPGAAPREDRPLGGGLYQPLGTSLHLMDGEFFSEAPDQRVIPPQYFTRTFSCPDLAHAFTVNVMRPRRYRRQEAKLPIVFLNDGQNQWTDQGMFGGWHTDTTARRLAAAGRCRDVVLAAVVMHPKRSLAYLPRPWGRAHVYADFLADVVLPGLATELPLAAEPDQVAILGSSWGAICAAYVAWRRPDVVGMVGSLSYSSLGLNPFTYDAVLLDLATRRAMPFRRAYFDAGERFVEDPANRRTDNTRLNERILSLFRRKGWDAPDRFRGFIAKEHCHNERWWRQRVGGALEFLFPPA